MSTPLLNLVIIVASTRRGRFGPTVTRWFEQRARQHAGFDIDLVDLAEAALPEILGDYTDPDPEPVRALGARLERADAFLVVTPEYNHSFPASIKTAIDWFYSEWHAKPVGFVSYAGWSGGLRAVEALRPVFAEVHATTIRDTVSFHNYPERFDPDGDLLDPDGPDQAANAMLDQLAWWAHALRHQRHQTPYTP